MRNLKRNLDVYDDISNGINAAIYPTKWNRQGIQSNVLNQIDNVKRDINPKIILFFDKRRKEEEKKESQKEKLKKEEKTKMKQK